jgi:hypothetical protein
MFAFPASPLIFLKILSHSQVSWKSAGELWAKPVF